MVKPAIHPSSSPLRGLLILACLMVFVPCGKASESPNSFREQVEADWLLQEHYRLDPALKKGEVTTAEDAAGGCDGVKNGTAGFHTGQIENPWWQVDLGGAYPIASVLVWNRCDGVADRASHLMLRLSEDGEAWRTVYTHDGTTFYGFTDNKPLKVDLPSEQARFVRIELPGKVYLHLDEVEVFGTNYPDKNLALLQPADESSISTWSKRTDVPRAIDWAARVTEILARCRQLAGELSGSGVDVPAEARETDQLATSIAAMQPSEIGQPQYLSARWLQRKLTLANPLLDFDSILFTKRVPGSFNHMSDQYYGWWSRPGGGLFLLHDFKSDAPKAECLTGPFGEVGSFLRPMLSYDAKRVLFAWCRYYPELAGLADKLNKGNVAEDAFYHLFEMNVDGSGIRQLTHGKYDDFDGRYLPDGRIVFLSTRRGQSLQCGRETAAMSIQSSDQPDIYVRCGGGPERPVAVYTLHTMNSDGGNLYPISPFEMFEWTPSVAADGRILYSRWDYIDRYNMPYMGLWSMNPDGTNPRVVYGNFTISPHATFEAKSIPHSNKIIFTASAHHAQTMGSLVLLDSSVGTEGEGPVTRLTPEVPFPEIEGWSPAYYTSPWPLSERHYLVSWGCVDLPSQGQIMAPNCMGLYLFDAQGGMELLYRDPAISCGDPIPFRPQIAPPVLAQNSNWDGPKEGRFLLADVYRGLKSVKPGTIKSLRIVAVPGKTHPTMNFPSIGLTKDDPGKCVLGTVPVEPDGSAYFRAPSGVIVFFQALDSRGMAVQTMRSVTHLQPGQTLSCIGCHEPRNLAPSQDPVMASRRDPSKITVGPEGSWPLRFDQLVQPVLDKHCVSCHDPGGPDQKAAQFDLTAAHSYDSLVDYATPSLRDQVLASYKLGYSTEGRGLARDSALLALLTHSGGHPAVPLDADALERLAVWMDTYAQKAGSFSPEQEQQLIEWRKSNPQLFIESGSKQTAIDPVSGEKVAARSFAQ